MERISVLIVAAIASLLARLMAKIVMSTRTLAGGSDGDGGGGDGESGGGGDVAGEDGKGWG